MVRTERFVLQCEKGFLSEDGFVADARKALQSVTREKMIQIHKDLAMYKSGDKNFKNLIFFITSIDVSFSTFKDEPNASWVSSSDSQRL